MEPVTLEQCSNTRQDDEQIRRISVANKVSWSDE